MWEMYVYMYISVLYVFLFITFSVDIVNTDTYNACNKAPVTSVDAYTY